MSWNYRVFRSFHKHPHLGDVFTFNIHEVYYDKNGKPKSWSENSIAPYGSSLDELKSDMQMMIHSLDKPILEVYIEDGIDKIKEV